jgi:hypothetical protein
MRDGKQLVELNTAPLARSVQSVPSFPSFRTTYTKRLQLSKRFPLPNFDLIIGLNPPVFLFALLVKTDHSGDYPMPSFIFPYVNEL